MIEYFYEGNPLFMSLVTIIGLIVLILIINILLSFVFGNQPSPRQIRSIPVAGSAAFMMGILAQAVGAYEAMGAIQAAVEIPPAIVAGGLRVSLIAPIYGLMIFVFTLLVYIGLQVFYTPDGEQTVEV